MAKKSKGNGAYQYKDASLKRVDPPGYNGSNRYQGKDIFENATKNAEEKGGFAGPVKYGTDDL